MNPAPHAGDLIRVSQEYDDNETKVVAIGRVSKISDDFVDLGPIGFYLRSRDPKVKVEVEILEPALPTEPDSVIRYYSAMECRDRTAVLGRDGEWRGIGSDGTARRVNLTAPPVSHVRVVLDAAKETDES